MDDVTREEHLEYCKKRALEYLDVGDIAQAGASFGSDMSKHPETRDHSALPLMFKMQFSGLLNTVEEMRKFINGFNSR